MADQQQLPMVPTQSVSQFAAAVNYNEILVTLGAPRVAMSVGAEGVPVPQVATEWLVTLAISPQAARTLVNILSTVVQQYETQFGTIPIDPNFKIHMNK